MAALQVQPHAALIKMYPSQCRLWPLIPDDVTNANSNEPPLAAHVALQGDLKPVIECCSSQLMLVSGSASPNKGTSGARHSLRSESWVGLPTQHTIKELCNPHNHRYPILLIQTLNLSGGSSCTKGV
eukprot:6247141-Amphidinium_carterae.1